MIKDYTNPTHEEVAKYQELLSTILMLSKIKYAKLADYLGVTRESIYYICSKHTKMTKTQYIAINVVLEYVIGEEKYKKILKMAKEYKEL